MLALPEPLSNDLVRYLSTRPYVTFSDILRQFINRNQTHVHNVLNKAVSKGLVYDNFGYYSINPENIVKEKKQFTNFGHYFSDYITDPRNKTCPKTGKVVFKDEAKAKRFAKHSNKYYNRGLRVYHCGMCGHWHMTSQPKKN